MKSRRAVPLGLDRGWIVKYRVFTFLSVTFVLAVPWLHAATEAMPPGEALLNHLHAELEHIRAPVTSESAGLQRPVLTPLVGLPRSQLAERLGAPDWCRPPSDNACRDSRHWAYFFYHWQPSSHAAAGGEAEVTIPTGGWAVEVDFSSQGVVTAASWVQER